jgi:hypothetical protein
MRRTQVRRSDESNCSNAAVGEFLRRHQSDIFVSRNGNAYPRHFLWHKLNCYQNYIKGGSAMIGAIAAKGNVKLGMEALNRRDVSMFMMGWA